MKNKSMTNMFYATVVPYDNIERDILAFKIWTMKHLPKILPDEVHCIIQ